MLKQLAEYLLQNRMVTVVVVLALSAAPHFSIPFLYSIGWIIMALVALRSGVVVSLPLLICTVLPVAVSYAHHGAFSPLLLCHWVLGPVLMWALACLLGCTASWRLTLEIGAGVSATLALLLHFVFPHQVMMFVSMLKPMVLPMLETKSHADPQVMQIAWQWLQSHASGLWVGMSYLIASILLIMARMWQSWAFNPGGWREEFLHIRFDSIYASLFFSVFLVSFFGLTWLQNVSLVMLWSFVISGMSLMHALLMKWSKENALWIVVFYLLVLLFLTMMVVIMALMGMVDSVVNVRKWQRV